MPKRAGRPSVAQTPAPKSDKIYGSKKNPKGSATEKKSKSIQLSDKTINTLKEKLDNFKKSHPNKKNINLNDLKAVYRRGSGAYSSSHRPTITGGAPNSRAAWSYARVNKFLKKAGGAKVKAAYVQDDDLMANGGLTRGGDCYEAAGQFCMGSVYMKEPVEFVGEPYLVHAEVKGQGKAEGIRFGHAWVEDDENVYDYSNARKIVMPKVVYYAIGDIQTENPLKYQRYTFPEARAKMLKTKHYGSWDIETEYAEGGMIDLIEGVKLDKNIYKQNIEHHSVYSKINSDIEAEKILKENFIQSFEKNVQIENDEICAYRLLMLDDISDLDTNNLGIYWAYSENKVVIADDEGYEHKNLSYKNKYVIKVKVNIKNINWQDTFDLYVMNDWMEGEIRFIKNTKPSEIYYKKLGDSEWIKLDKDVKFADGGMIAPNGKPSNLTPEQYKLVRTPEFKAWFGDWENDPENASKVVDENGEPKVVYHGSRSAFSIFDIKKSGESSTPANVGFWFTPIKNFAYNFASTTWYGNSKEINVYPVFLSIKSPKIYNSDSEDSVRYSSPDNIGRYPDSYQKFKIDIWAIDGQDADRANIGGIGMMLNNQKETIKKYRESLVNEGFDGIFINKTRFDKGEAGGLNDQIVALFPNQIKLADGSNTTFDMNNEDIRFEDGGEASQHITCINCGWEWETADSAESDKYVCHQCGFDNSLFYDGGILKPTMTLEQIAEANLMKDYLKPVSIEYLEEQLDKGMQKEKDHTDNDEVAKKIALHHLAERPDYYEELEKMKLEDGGEVSISDEDYEFWIGGDENFGKAIKQDGVIVGGIAYDEDDQQINGIVIKNKFRKKGLAKKTIKALFDKNPDLQRVYVRAVPESKAFWKKIGTDFSNYNEDAGLWEGYVNRFDDGGNVILEDNSLEEYDIQDFLRQQKEEAHMVMTCNDSKIYKAIICKTKCEIAIKRMSETENAEELNAWNSYKNIWSGCMQDIIDNNIEMYKAGGKTCGCGCGSIYSKGGLAYSKFSKGGLAYGNSHDKGGMPLKVKSTGQNIEIEGGEGVVNKRIMQSSKKVEFEGKQMTPCEAVSKINEMGGGVKFKCADVKNIIEEDGQF